MALGVAAAAVVGGVAALPASAAPVHQLTITAQPNPDQPGDPVLIFGRLTGPNSANRVVRLWHRVHPNRRFTPTGTTATTNANGFYEIPRAEGVVDTNRDWFVRSAGVRSRTVHEKVQAIVSLDDSATTAVTNQPVTFTGHVTPGRFGERVVLQRQIGGDGGRWVRVNGTQRRTAPDGTFRIVHRFRVADTYTLRIRFLGDRMNLPDTSDSVDLVVDQRQNPNLTLSPSADPISAGQTVNLTGTLAGVTSPQPVTLYGHLHGQRYQAMATTMTDASGNYSFTQAPLHTTAYQVRGGGRRSAQVFEAVRDVVTAAASTDHATVGDTVTFTGTVAPDKTGHWISLQRLGEDGHWHDIQWTKVGAGSTFSIGHVVQSPGVKTYRVHIYGGPFNWGGASATFTVTVAPPAS